MERLNRLQVIWKITLPGTSRTGIGQPVCLPFMIAWNGVFSVGPFMLAG